MNNIDVSKVNLFSEFPPLVDFQEATIQFTLPSNSGTTSNPVSPFTTLLYDQTHSVAIDKSEGVADIRIHYDGMRAVGTPTGSVDSGTPPTGGDYKDDITWNVRSTTFDFCSALASYRVSGKNVSFTQLGQNPNVATANVTDPYYALNFFVWFEGGRLYCRATLNHGLTTTRSGYTYAWTGGTVTLAARVSLLPY